VFGVFEGHGPNAQLLSRYVQSKMLKAIQNDVSFLNAEILGIAGKSAIRKRVRRLFKQVQKDVIEQYKNWLNLSISNEK
jgi:hypothetical protein